jgi:hypothetical protein
LTDPCCQGIEVSIDQLNKILAPLYPFFQLIGCASSAIQLLQLIPQAIGPPPDVGAITKIAGILQKLVSCAGLILSYTPLYMGVEIACLVKGLSQFVSALLTCLMTVVRVNVQMSTDAFLCSQSSDPGLRAMGICLAQQSSALQNALLDKLGSLNSVFNLFNLILEMIPGVGDQLKKAGMLPIPLTFDTSAPVTNTDAIQSVINIFNIIYGVTAAICV